VVWGKALADKGFGAYLSQKQQLCLQYFFVDFSEKKSINLDGFRDIKFGNFSTIPALLRDRRVSQSRKLISRRGLLPVNSD